MKLFKVFHNQEVGDHFSFHWGTRVMPKSEKLDLAAMVNAYNLEDALRCTNHQDTPWWDNPNVFSFMRGRSTSYGDVIEDEDERRYLVAAYGFKEIV